MDNLYKLSVVTELCAHTVCKTYAWGMIIAIATIYWELIYAKLRALHKLSHLILKATLWGGPYCFLQFENDETWDTETWGPAPGPPANKWQRRDSNPASPYSNASSFIWEASWTPNHWPWDRLGSIWKMQIPRFHKRSSDSKSIKMEPRICTSIKRRKWFLCSRSLLLWNVYFFIVWAVGLRPYWESQSSLMIRIAWTACLR